VSMVICILPGTIDPAHLTQAVRKERLKRSVGNGATKTMGHNAYTFIMEAATVHYYATGVRTLLDIALKNADSGLFCFGPLKQARGTRLLKWGRVVSYGYG